MAKQRHISLEKRIENAVKAHERKTGERVIRVEATLKKQVGFCRPENLEINYWTRL